MASKSKKKKTKQPTSSLSQVFRRRNLSSAFLFVSTIFFAFGGGQISAGSIFASWLMSFGALLVAIAIIINQDVWHYIRDRLTTFWQRALLTIIFCTIIVTPIFIIFQNITNDQREQLAKTPIFYGTLEPANEPMPPSSSQHPDPDFPVLPDDFRIMLGDDSGYFIRGSVNNSFYFNKKPIFTVKETDSGRIVLSAEVLDSTNNKVVKIIDNEFQANPNYAFRPRQPDKHSLIVRDSDGVEVLNVRYINSNVLWITGRFYSPDDPYPITIKHNGDIEYRTYILGHIYTSPLKAGQHIFLGSMLPFS